MRADFRVVYQEGSHVELRKLAAGKRLTVIVPAHHELARRTQMCILRQAEMSIDEFRRLM